MPQITLKISKNIDISQLDLNKLFAAIHDAMSKVPGTDVRTCHSGVIQEDFSYIGLGDEKLTKLYLEVYWLLNEEKLAYRKTLAADLMKILEEIAVPQIVAQQLLCIPRVRIADLGKLNQEYYISALKA